MAEIGLLMLVVGCCLGWLLDLGNLYILILCQTALSIDHHSSPPLQELSVAALGEQELTAAAALGAGNI